MPPGTTRPLICPWPSVGLRKPKWEALPGSSKPFHPLITQSKVCLSVEVFRRTRYRADPLAPGTFLNAVKMCFKLVCSLNLKCASAFFKGQNLAQQNQTKKKKKKRERISPPLREVCLVTLAVPMHSGTQKKKVSGPASPSEW